MALNDYVDAYCERIDPGFWGEPLNAVSNIGFLIAGALLVAQMRRAPGLAPLSIRLLPALLMLVGLGSFAFHTLATVWAGWLDTGFILAFACAFFYAFFRHVGGASWWWSGAAAFAFFWLSFGAKAWLPDLGLNGSEAYSPMLAGLLAMTVWLRRNPAAFKSFLAASLVFCVSVALRTVDRAVCDGFPLGTHFVWHLLNAMVLYILTAALITGVRDEESVTRRV
jgi:hypothetical protein